MRRSEGVAPGQRTGTILDRPNQRLQHSGSCADTPHTGIVALADRVVRGEGVEMCRLHRVVSEPFERSAFAGYRFPPEVILLAVRWYLRYGLSYRDVEELLAERGIDVDHVTIYRWVQRFTPLLIDAARPCRHAVSGRWFVDETYVRVAGRWRATCIAP